MDSRDIDPKNGDNNAVTDEPTELYFILNKCVSSLDKDDFLIIVILNLEQEEYISPSNEQRRTGVKALLEARIAPADNGRTAALNEAGLPERVHQKAVFHADSDHFHGVGRVENHRHKLELLVEVLH